MCVPLPYRSLNPHPSYPPPIFCATHPSLTLRFRIAIPYCQALPWKCFLDFQPSYRDLWYLSVLVPGGFVGLQARHLPAIAFASPFLFCDCCVPVPAVAGITLFPVTLASECILSLCRWCAGCSPLLLSRRAARR